MRKSLVWVGLLAVGACGRGGAPSGLQSGETRALVSHTPAVVQASQEVGPVAPSTQLDLRVLLPIADQDDLDNLLAGIYDPNSPEYHHYLTPTEFSERFYPTGEALQTLRDALGDAGFVTADAPQGGMLAASVTARVAERFFQTRLTNYVAPDGTAFISPSADVNIPAGLAVAAVYGLDSGFRAHNNLVEPAAIGSNAAVKQFAMGPNDIRNAYDIPATARGAGQELWMVELDGFNMADLTKYESTYNLPNVPVKTVLLDGYSGAAGAGQDEVNLDLDVAVAMAPDLKAIRVIESTNTAQGFLDTFNECANPTQPDKYLPPVVSCSWGIAETSLAQSDVNAFNQIFQQMAVQGQSVFVATGDAGARDDGKTISVDNPASQPYVVGVGGTTLVANLAATTGAYTSESAWAGGGGGISTFWSTPPWQQGVVSASSKGSSTKRNIPDVSAAADPNTSYVIVTRGKAVQVGGTSAAAPMWTAFIALVNAQRASTGLEPMGFVSPVLYALGKSAKYGTNFHDVADGSTNGFYPAVTGYDDATGWGSFQGSVLLPTLASGFVRRPFTSPF